MPKSICSVPTGKWSEALTNHMAERTAIFHIGTQFTVDPNYPYKLIRKWPNGLAENIGRTMCTQTLTKR